MSAFAHLRIPAGEKTTSQNHHLLHSDNFEKVTLNGMHRTDNWAPYGGIAVTLLNKKLALNFEASYTHAIPKGDYKFGDFVKTGISIGYLVLPREYKSYNQVNFNLYFEPKLYHFNKNEIAGSKVENSGGLKGELAFGGQLVFFSSAIFEFGYIRSFAEKTVDAEKNVFFSGIRYLFF